MSYMLFVKKGQKLKLCPERLFFAFTYLQSI